MPQTRHLFYICANSLLEIQGFYDKIINNNCGYVSIFRRDNMKKFLLAGALFGVLFSVFSVNVARAAAQSCQIRENGRCNNDNEYLSIPGVRGCYICERGECVTGDLVSATKATLDKKSYENYMFRCQLGFDDKWIPEKIPNCTQAEYTRLCQDSNAKEVIINLNTGKPVFNDNSSQAVVGAQPCMGCVCIPGYTAVDGKCISDADIAAGNQCAAGGGKWTGSACTCDPSKNIKQSADKKSCVCINSDYEPDGVNGCKKTQAAINAENQQRQQAENRKRQQACEQSGGVWANNQCSCDNAKNLRAENNVCVCLDDENYVRNGDRCDLTDAAALQQKCTSADSVASGAYWDDVNKQCRCTNQQYAWNGSVCAMNPAIQKCLLITGANWDYSRNQCYCMEVGKTLNADGTACIDATVSSSGDTGVGAVETTITQQQNAARERIEGAVSKLDEIASGLKLTVWRNEEGKFNTSRLLSDSIAGVVLGTAGGLITSHVVKKNNIENGFEDIQCTVGGQVVAGWGDQFRVGIQ